MEKTQDEAVITESPAASEDASVTPAAPTSQDPSQDMPERLTSVQGNWTDITDDFFVACDDLSLGELLHDAK